MIGNKGSGKSALLDTLGLLGDSGNFADFSFLNTDKFLHPRSRLAGFFVGNMQWQSDEVFQKSLDEVGEPHAEERVRYLPQQYIEKLCNELKEVAPGSFESELRGIVFSHVDDADRLGFSNMDELLEYLSEPHEKQLQTDRKKLSEVNRRLVEVERALRPERTERIRKEKKRLDAELAAHEASRPEEVQKPEEAQAPEGSEELSRELKEATEELAGIRKEIEEKAMARSENTKRAAVANRITSRLKQTRKIVEDFQEEIRPELEELGIADEKDVISIEVNVAQVEAIGKEAEAAVTKIDAELESEAADSITARQITVSSKIEELKAQLAEPQRRYLAYLDALKIWEQARAEIIGSPEVPGTVEYFAARIAEVERLPEKLDQLKVERSTLARTIHSTIREIADTYKKLYEPITTFLSDFNKDSDAMPVSFAVEIMESGLADDLWTVVNRQVRGSFSGLDESVSSLEDLLRSTDFNNEDEAVAFAEEIDHRFHFDIRDGMGKPELDPQSQLRKGQSVADLYDRVFGIGYLNPTYSLQFGEKSLEQLSPGERGLLLLIFYLLVDKSDIPLIVDQPEENLDNQTIYETLVRAVSEAVRRRQVVVATHSSNVAVVCDADQVIYASRDPDSNVVRYECGSLENPPTNEIVLNVLEGTKPAFVNRRDKLFSAR